jgi:hypothetical protein
MLNNKVVVSIAFLKQLLSVLFAVVGLASCTGGVIASGSTNAVPTVSISATSISVPYNTNTSINWSSTNSTSCASSPSALSGVSGTYTSPRLTSTTTYTVTCVGAGGTAIGSIKINVANSTITAFADAGGGNVTVTSANNLTNGMSISISGTTHYNGSYTISNVTSSRFTIVHAFSGNDATGTWQLTGGMISGCSTNGATGSIALANIPSRFMGVAPLSVFFDASNTTATATTSPFHDLEFRWDFGENQTALAALPGGTNWTNGSTKGNRNLATGPVTAHVYETPGVYLVALTATDGTNTVSNSCAQIVVENPDAVFDATDTICISSNSDPTPGSGGCPAGSAHYQQADFGTALSQYIATGKRLLFKRGDTFTEASGARVSVAGPGTIGAYGIGAKPAIHATGGWPVLTLSSPNTPTFSDWRVMDLYLDGLSGANAHGVLADGSVNQLTLLRIDAAHVSAGFSLNSSVLQYYNGSGSPGHHIHEQLAIVDSTVDYPSQYGAFISAHNFSLMGNSITNGTPTRFSQLVKAVISNNYMYNAAPTKELIKLHAPTNCDSTVTPGCNYTNDTFPLVNAVSNDGVNTFGYSEYMEIADNKLVSGSNADYMITAGTQNNTSDERTRHFIFERNWLVASASTQMVLGIMSRNVTVRNNICDMSLVTTGSGRCFNAGNWGIEPPPDSINIYNNTVYSSSAGTVQVVLLFPVTTNVKVKNNLGYTPAASGSVMIAGSSGSGYSASNNSTNSQMISYNPNFISPLSGPDGFKVAANSYAVGAGAVVPVWSDFFSVPQTPSRDMGAVIH